MRVGEHKVNDFVNLRLQVTEQLIFVHLVAALLPDIAERLEGGADFFP